MSMSTMAVETDTKVSFTRAFIRLAALKATSRREFGAAEKANAKLQKELEQLKEKMAASSSSSAAEAEKLRSLLDKKAQELAASIGELKAAEVVVDQREKKIKMLKAEIEKLTEDGASRSETSRKQVEGLELQLSELRKELEAEKQGAE